MNSETSHSAAKPRAGLSAILEAVLRHESALAASLHDYEWRVRGSPLLSVKRLFAEQGRQIDRWVNELARSAGGLSAVTGGTVARSGEPLAADPAAPRVAVADLLARHEAAISELRVALDTVARSQPDGEPALLLSGVLEFHETAAWMLRLLLDSPARARMV
jgi:starvation-inducible DNA-binding protein